MLTETFLIQLLILVLLLIAFGVVILFVLRNNSKQFKAMTDGLSPLLGKVDQEFEKKKQEIIAWAESLKNPKPPVTGA